MATLRTNSTVEIKLKAPLPRKDKPKQAPASGNAAAKDNKPVTKGTPTSGNAAAKGKPSVTKGAPNSGKATAKGKLSVTKGAPTSGKATAKSAPKRANLRGKTLLRKQGASSPSKHLSKLSVHDKVQVVTTIVQASLILPLVVIMLIMGTITD